MADKLTNHAKIVRFDIGLNCARYVGYPVTGHCCRNSLVQRLFRNIHQLLRQGATAAHRHRPGGIANKPIVKHSDINTYDVTQPQLPLGSHPVDDFFIYRQARVTRKLPVPQKRALCAIRLDPLRCVFVHLPGRHTRPDKTGNFIPYFSSQQTRWPHQF